MYKYVLGFSLVFLLSCQSNVICPAFQSTYILDDSVRQAHFSYVWQLDENTRAEFLSAGKSSTTQTDSTSVAYASYDSTASYASQQVMVDQPQTDYYAYAAENSVVPWRPVKKTKYGIVKSGFFPVKSYRMKTAPMKNVLAPEPISNDFDASDFYDTLATDSSYASSDSLLLATSIPIEEGDTTKYLFYYDPNDDFNVEQEYYNKYFGEQLVDKRKEPKPVLDSLGNVVYDSMTVKEPFFERLKDFFSFGKKNTNDTTGFATDDQVEESIQEEGQVEPDTL